MINPQRKAAIIKKAEKIGLQFMENDCVNLLAIAESEKIYVNFKKLKKQHEGAFDGLIMHKEGDFMIVINTKYSSEKNSPRTRFTLAHELGHYFIKEHNQILRQNQSLTYRNKSAAYNYTQVEQEANLFASNLLMPRSKFVGDSSEFPIGFNQIIGLANKFQSSLSCAAYHFVNNNIHPCILIRDKGNKISTSVSNSMRKKLPRKYEICVNEGRGTMESSRIALSENLNCTQSLSVLSSWVSNIDYKSPKNELVIEQTLNLGEHGTYTLILPYNSLSRN